MTLEEFIKIKKHKLEAFEKWYEEERRNEPEYYPSDLMLSAWNEQLEYFIIPPADSKKGEIE